MYVDDPTVMSGAPCAVQVFTNRMRDEECLVVSEVIDGCLNGSVAKVK